MEKRLVLIFAIGFLSFLNAQNSEVLIDNTFQKCFNHEISNREGDLSDMYGEKFDLIIKDKSLLEQFEIFLVEENYLKSRSKKSYLELFQNFDETKVDHLGFKKFIEELDFDPYWYFHPIYSLICYAKVNSLKLINSDNWRYKTALEFNYYEADGKQPNKHLINSLNYIPTEKFDKIQYRQLFLNEIYAKLYYLNYRNRS